MSRLLPVLPFLALLGCPKPPAAVELPPPAIEPAAPDYSAFFMADTVVSLVRDGTLDEALVDDKVRRILRVMHGIHMFTGDRPEGAYSTAEHQATARAIADEAIVLLKNDGMLPLEESLETRKMRSDAR